MNVGELRKALEGIGPEITVVVDGYEGGYDVVTGLTPTTVYETASKCEYWGRFVTEQTGHFKTKGGPIAVVHLGTEDMRGRT